MRTFFVIGVFLCILSSFLSGCANTGLSNSDLSPVDSEPDESQTSLEDGDIFNKSIQFPSNTVLVDELNNEEGSLFFLGMTKAKVITLLNNNNMYYNCAESDLGGYVIDFLLFDGFFLLMFDEDQSLLNLIEIRGDTPNKATSTQAGLMLGDTYDKMISLYGSNYTVYKSETYDSIYEFSYNSYYLQIYFLNDIVFQWGISLQTYANTYHTAFEEDRNSEISSIIPTQNNDAVRGSE